MSEVAIILSDLPAAAADVPSDSVTALPALTRLGRFGQIAASPGWRAWLASWLSRPDLAQLAGGSPAVLAAAAVSNMTVADGAGPGSVWLATPVQLTAGLRSVHMPADGLLQLDRVTATELVEHFNASFAELGFTLHALPGGGFLAQGPPFETLPITLDPARLSGGDLAGSTPQGPGAAPLLRLGAELEMWLHGHHLNAARARLRQPAISTLWLWGGGALRSLTADTAAAGSLVLGEDAFACGLSALSGARYQDGRPDARAVLEAARSNSRVAAIVSVLAPLAGSAGPVTMLDLLQQFDANLLSPLLAAVGPGGIERVSLLANDSVTTLKRRDQLKFWRRSPGPKAVLC